MAARAAIVVIALALGTVAVPVVGAANEISNQPTCRDVGRSGEVARSGETCFAGSTQRRAVVAGLMILAAAAAVLAMVAGGVVGLRGGRGIAVVAFGLLAVGLFLAAYAAARV